MIFMRFPVFTALLLLVSTGLAPSEIADSVPLPE